jgi:hypothetical protein
MDTGDGATATSSGTIFAGRAASRRRTPFCLSGRGSSIRDVVETERRQRPVSGSRAQIWGGVYGP